MLNCLSETWCVSRASGQNSPRCTEFTSPRSRLWIRKHRSVCVVNLQRATASTQGCLYIHRFHTSVVLIIPLISPVNDRWEKLQLHHKITSTIFLCCREAADELRQCEDSTISTVWFRSWTLSLQTSAADQCFCSPGPSGRALTMALCSVKHDPVAFTWCSCGVWLPVCCVDSVHVLHRAASDAFSEDFS